MKLRKWKALLIKDTKLVFKNKNIILLLLLPPIFALVYSNLFTHMVEDESIYVLLSLITGLGLMVIGSSVMAMAISEEKEKKTLRSLLLSDVSAIEFILSKMVIILILFTLMMSICYLIVGAPRSYMLEYLLIIVLSTISLLLISSIVGILSPTQQASSVLSAPIMFALGIPMFALMGLNEVLLIVSKFFPTGPALFMLNAKAGLMDNYPSLLGYSSMILWILISLSAFTYFYKKNSIDN
ncbi:ABC transporter permease [Erysipelothrix sp. HDW6A]|uniref:ABC transporter permease n=1 Tax=Erysipelothrix sp. HDW6A TaxID=2714928 RepID=UPI00140BFF12|nr:ABC transporter permease [Erysipelothrix sp. HDW6A]QIK57058.1 ABC transporter permease [Erysipelothrix sp. HDW6A]